MNVADESRPFPKGTTKVVQGGQSQASQLVFDIIGSTYTVLFTIELVLRILGFGFRNLFFGPEWAWSLLDLFIVTTSLWDLFALSLEVSSDTHDDAGGVSGMASLKAFRIIRNEAAG